MAMEVCGSSKVCLYDSLALNDTDIGMATLEINETNTVNMVLSTNFPPNLTLVETIEAVVGQMVTLQLEAVDPDGDNITYQLLRPVKGASISDEDGLFTWTPANKSKVSLGFLATDGKANATMEPVVKLCSCENGGSCLFDQYVSGTNLLQDRFGVVLCQCKPGWTGEFCEMDYDACADDPCFIGVTCSDEAPPSFNSTCGPCPVGFEGDGKSCQDVDECELYRDQPASNGGRGCDQNCVNVLMNYTCSCNPGYFLGGDGRRCIETPNITVPSVEDRCINEAEGPVEVMWEDVTATNTAAEDIICTESIGGTNVSSTGGVFGVGYYVVTCRVDLPFEKVVSTNFSFSIFAIPTIIVPKVETRQISPGQVSISVTWDEVNATNASGRAITCTDDTGGTNVTVSGGDFPLGSHNVTCSLTNNLGCFASASFAFDVIETTTPPVSTTTPVSATIPATPTTPTTTTPALTTTPASTPMLALTPTPTSTTTASTATPASTTTPTSTPTPALTTTPTSTPTPALTTTPTSTPTPASTTTPTSTPTPALTTTPTSTPTPASTTTPKSTTTPASTTTPKSTTTPALTTTPASPTTATTPSATTGCQALSCLNGGTFDTEFCECVCPLAYSGVTCSDENLCLSGNRCSAAEHYCLPATNQDGFTCTCNVFNNSFPQDDGSCRQHPSKHMVVTAELDFNPAFNNPTSAAFRKQAAVFEQAIFLRLKGNPSTNDVSSVHVPLMEEGSTVVRSVASFQNAAPSDAILQQVLASNASLSDGNTVIYLYTNSVIVNDQAIGCVPSYCKNGGTCEISGNAPYVSFTCSCPASYTGDRCEVEIQGPGSGGLPTIATVFIILGCILLLVVVCMLACACLLAQRQRGKLLAPSRDSRWPAVPRNRRGILDNDQSRGSGDSFSQSNIDDEEGFRLERIMQVMSQSPYQQEGLPVRGEFIRPYVVTGMKGPHREDPPQANHAGRVVRNPMLN
ncbi:uncharacterized protein PB18E9.04c-like [Acanthaster planci]|uniref:Uncharacterized protein PB18E9.04c-like n=1 Tax=Acanthaster planci TaxID=133434 RepID=A0A8B7Z8A2_ACAPL|nr:uncharacterized protein PB18E9.04c-like [Acanthaster planci]